MNDRMRRSPLPPDVKQKPSTITKPSDDNVYEMPVSSEAGTSSAEPSAYEVPNSTLSKKSGAPVSSRIAANDRSVPPSLAHIANPNASLPRTVVLPERQRPSPSVSEQVRPPLPLNTVTPADNASDEYYDSRPLDRPMVTVWIRGKLRFQMNFYLAASILVVITLLAVISTIVWIVLVARDHGKYQVVEERFRKPYQSVLLDCSVSSTVNGTTVSLSTTTWSPRHTFTRNYTNDQL